MKNLCVLLLFLLAYPLLASAQKFEFSGGYGHVSGDGGLDGFNIGAAGWVTHKVSIAFDYDSGWDTSHLGVFELTQTGLIVSKNHLQTLLLGPRIFFPGAFKNREKHIAHLMPFAEAQFGVSNLDSKLVDPTTGAIQKAADSEFTWMIGGGADYRISSHWVGRLKIDLLRTHLADTGQSRLRCGMGIAYTFGER